MVFDALENGNILLSKVKATEMGVFVANAMDVNYCLPTRVGEVRVLLST